MKKIDLASVIAKLDMSKEELASILEVRPETVHHWIKNSTAMPAHFKNKVKHMLAVRRMSKSA